MTGLILALRGHLVAQQVTSLVMEATGNYWKPFCYLLEDGPFEVQGGWLGRRYGARGLHRWWLAAGRPSG